MGKSKDKSKNKSKDKKKSGSSISKSSSSSMPFESTSSISDFSNSNSSSFSFKKLTTKRKKPLSYVVGTPKSLAGLKIPVVRITNENDFKKYYPRYPQKVTPKYWELPSHKTFFNWVESTYARYKSTVDKEEHAGQTRRLFRHQQLVRDFMQDKSPMRGILLYHGLGVGKTCASIVIAEASKSKKEVVFLSKTKLESNFIDQLKDCGHDYYLRRKNWVFSRCTTPQEKKLAGEIGIPLKVIAQNKGVFFIDQYKKGNNYASLGKLQEKLDYQINEMIKQRYTFKHLDDTGLSKKLEEFPFDNKVVIIDEVHNLINGMVNNGKTGTAIEKALMKARDCKIVFLSGTPLVNDVFEASKIYNILRGPIKTHIFRLLSDNGNINWNLVRSSLKQNIYIDQILIQKPQKLLKITQNPKNFVTDPSGNGIIYQPQRKISPEVFVSSIRKRLENIGYQVQVSTEQYTALPTSVKEFDTLFYNRTINKLKNIDVIKKRIVGLTSYVASNEDMPDKTGTNIVLVPMSNYQLDKYKKYRNEEIQKDKKQRGKAKNDEKIKSSYKIVSRIYCTFAFPEEIGSPYDSKEAKLLEELEEQDLENIVEHSGEDNLKQIRQVEKDTRIRYLRQLEKKADKYFNPEALAVYAPKYLEMIHNIKKNEGCALVYSQFVTLTGLNTFALALQVSGNYAPFDIKKVGGEWELDEKPEDRDKPKYIIWSGGTQIDKQSMFINIFNSKLDNLPYNCQKLKDQLRKKYGKEMNVYGNVIKLFMTTKSGAEGINLHNIRQVHIMESYWQPALISQIIGRATRKGSHMNLPPNKRNFEVFYYLASLSAEQNETLLTSRLVNIKNDIARYDDGLGMKGKIATSDEALYILSYRKQQIINGFYKIMKEVSFDCGLNAIDNYDPVNPIVCMDYESTNRDEYTYGPSLEDTMYVADTQQEWDVQVGYIEFTFPPGPYGRKFYTEINPSPGQKRYIYDSDFKKGGRSKPVGELLERDGKVFPAFYKSANIKFNKRKSQSKSKSQEKKKPKSQSKSKSQEKKKSKSQSKSKSQEKNKSASQEKKKPKIVHRRSRTKSKKPAKK